MGVDDKAKDPTSTAKEATTGAAPATKAPKSRSPSAQAS